MDDACGSAGESALHYLRMLDNTHRVGRTDFTITCGGDSAVFTWYAH